MLYNVIYLQIIMIIVYMYMYQIEFIVGPVINLFWHCFTVKPSF